MKTEMASLKSFVEHLTDRVNTLENRLAATETRLEKYEKASETKNTWANSETSTEDMYYEADLRHRKRKYLILSGVPEETSGNVAERRDADSLTVSKIASAIGIQNFEPKDTTRVGRIDKNRPRLLRFKCGTTTEKFNFLQKSKALSQITEFQKVFINQDLTPCQRKRQKQLRDELKERRRAGEKVTIHKGRVVLEHETKQHFQ